MTSLTIVGFTAGTTRSRARSIFRRYSLYVWDNYYPADSYDKKQGSYRSVKEAKQAVAPPNNAGSGWNFRVVDRFTKKVMYQWSSAS